MNIFLHELKAYRKSTIIWTCSLAALAVMYIFIFAALGNDIGKFQEFIGRLPDVARKALSIFAESLSTLQGFYALVFVYVVLCGAIQAMNLGTSIISKEVRDKTADFLLSKPVSRVKIVTCKLLAAVTSLVITNILYILITSFVAMNIKSESFNLKVLLMISGTLFFVQLIFMSLGFIVSVIVPKIKSVISVSLVTVFGFFIAGMIGSIIGEKAVRYITPFKYFDLEYIIKNASYETPFIVLSIVIVAAAISASYFIYSKKDIHAV